jgi:hypothetical protein
VKTLKLKCESFSTYLSGLGSVKLWLDCVVEPYLSYRIITMNDNHSIGLID